MSGFDLHSLVRENIRELKPYRSARDDFDKGILLDANENSMGSPIESDLELNRYPMPLQEELRAKIAAYRKVKPSQVFTGVGSDEAIDLLFRIFCIPGHDRILINPPTYGMYKVSAKINDVQVDEVLLDENFQLRPDKILEQVTTQTKLIFICSPNNPTANSIKRDDIIKVLSSFNGIVVVDEAYIDFSGTGSMAAMTDEYPNLVVLQTLSKAFGLAGIRLGIAIASEEIISYMLKVKAPYNINKLTSKAAIEAFDHVDKVQENVRRILDERKRMEDMLAEIEEVDEVFPSDANFLVFRVKNALKVYEVLAAEGVVVRYRGNEPGCENGLRLTIGTPEENDFFIHKLQEILKKI
ncbi:histidinol-phosphate transaminase [Balneola sp. MJW-20]|uniref:histidinol-phosphate transaminase n=1 Tax=Gracilimonas aurantiaca TaxID=3234185 RepID=UPI0034677B52